MRRPTASEQIPELCERVARLEALRQSPPAPEQAEAADRDPMAAAGFAERAPSSSGSPGHATDLNPVLERLGRIDQRLAEIEAVVKEGADEGRTHYTPREFAEKLIKEGIRTFKGGVEGGTRLVQKWCREKRLKAERRPSGRGKHGEFMIPRAAYVWFKNHGLLPRPKD
jgi:hypothetical protein